MNKEKKVNRRGGTMIGLDNVSDMDYIVLRSEGITKEEYDEIIDLVKQILRRHDKNEKRIIQELDFTSWMSLR